MAAERFRVECSAKVESGTLGQPIEVPRLRAFLATIPQDAELHPILRDAGSQRDPVRYLAGVVARWVQET